jgi:hypothetical protein
VGRQVKPIVDDLTSLDIRSDVIGDQVKDGFEIFRGARLGKTGAKGLE